MKGLYDELLEIPLKAAYCFKKNQNIKLPEKVPYIGMGSSYFAALTLYYCGADIFPEIASEYYYYLSNNKKPLGVLVSQSGESSETVWNLEKFKKVVSVVNNKNSTLAKAQNVSQVIQMFAGKENYSSTKTYINTLITLYLGLGINPKKAIDMLIKQTVLYEKEAKSFVNEFSKYKSSYMVNGYYVIGSGPNIGTAYEGALTLSETTKLPWIGMSVSQYDHGPKEAANNKVIVVLNGYGKDKKRIRSLKEILKSKTNALIIEFKEKDINEKLTPITLIARLNVFMNYLADVLKPGMTFVIGNKVSNVSDIFK